MRPAGEVRLALLGAALELVPPEVRVNPQAPRPTLREIAHKAQVGLDAATVAIKDMTRRNAVLKPVRTRQVDYCNKPVAEYEPIADRVDSGSRHGEGWVDLGRIVSGWAR